MTPPMEADDDTAPVLSVAEAVDELLAAARLPVRTRAQLIRDLDHDHELLFHPVFGDLAVLLARPADREITGTLNALGNRLAAEPADVRTYLALVAERTALLTPALARPLAALVTLIRAVDRRLAAEAKTPQ